ncbi:Tetratricopeptide repeat-containing protein [Saccharicrinis carchari]|uniref:Tetratricopeptide repeat-containing protein n=1 Tax=Saccharicrinis carchari TaxID=1168039 RepID=A0A521DFQ8_SACCC|nr:tetratricopeptide repeat protein [Saccharicrinis carchari]SMO70448.1 Tetratricopeptide repeat-containing protein [Saccharicrinis carchari]
MNKYIYIFISLTIFGACTLNEGAIQEGQLQADVPLSIRETDSVVVANLINRSKIYYDDNTNTAMAFDQFLLEAEELAQKNGFNKSLAEIFTMASKRYRNRSEYGEAIKYANQALELAKKIGDTALLSNYINMAAVIYRRVDENSQAMQMHMEAMELAEQVNDTFQLSVALNGIGNVYLGLKRYHASIEYFKKSFDIAVQQNNILGLAINTNNIGEALKFTGQLDSALVYFYQSLEYNKQINSEVGYAICYNSIGDTYRLKNDFSKALKYLKQALVLNEKTRDKINVSVSYSMLGETYLQVYDYARAIEHLKEGLNIAVEIGSKYQIEACSRLLARCYEKTNQLQSAIGHLKVAQTYKDSIFNEASLRHITVVRAKHEADKSKARIQQLNIETGLQKKLILQQKRAILYFVFFVLALIAGSVLIYRQIKLNAGYKSILMQQRLLRSQMNPHFIFNALSAIQVYILENDMENSSKFLSHFARLMRQVLRSSEKEYVSLEEEKNMLNYYLKLQQLRFVQPFTYNITFDKSISETSTLIPPMITQPFVENAVEHGLKSVEKNGLIEVRFLQDNNTLVIEIEDNGIGLSDAKMLKKGGVKHESMAIRITNERLQMIERMTKKQCALSILDLHSNSTQKSGVLVKITIPIIQPDSSVLDKNKSSKIRKLFGKLMK